MNNELETIRAQYQDWMNSPLIVRERGGEFTPYDVRVLLDHIKSLEEALNASEIAGREDANDRDRYQSALRAIRDSNPPLPSERNKSYYWMSRAKHYQEIADNALETDAAHE